VKKKKKRIPNKIAVIGKKTGEFLAKNDIKVDLIPDKYNAKMLLNAFKNISLTGQRILLPVSNLSDDFLKKGLEKQGCSVDKIIVYHTQINSTLDGRKLRSAIKKGTISCLTFFSPSAFQFFIEILNNDIINLISGKNIPVAAIGDTTERAIMKKGLQVQIKPEQSSEENMLDEIIKFFKINKH
jgi:uroporphyrinogen-III synthase